MQQIDELTIRSVLGYTGQFCDAQIDFCIALPCANNGLCIRTATGFVCICTPIYTGPTCLIRMDPCLSQPCIASNTLNCTSNNNETYNCLCRTGFTGLTCAQTTNSCALLSSPCKNGGTCINTVDGYNCQCNSSYQGSDCSIPIDPCASNPCVPSGSIACQAMKNATNYDFTCTCQRGHTGKC